VVIFSVVVFGGLLAGIGVLVPWLWFLSIVGVATFAYALEASRTEARLLTGLKGSLFGLVFSATALFWGWDILPLSWTGISDSTGWNLVCIYWLSTSLVFGLFFGVFALVYGLLEKLSTWMRTLFAASLWVLIQYGQMWAFAILTIGPGSLVVPHFSATMLGYAFAHFSPLLWLASFGGIYFLTFAAAAVGFGLYFLFERYAHGLQNRVVLVSFFVLACTCLTVLDSKFYLVRSSEVEDTSITVGLVTTDLPPTTSGTQEYRDHYNGYIRELIAKSSSTISTLNLIVFPETASVVSGVQGKPQETIHELFGETSPAVIDAALVQTTEGRLKRLFVYDHDAELNSVYDKMLLVPQAEYMPTIYRRPLTIVGGERFAHEASFFASLLRGDNAAPAVMGDAKVGAMICSDLLSPTLYRGLANDGANILVNVSGNGWFHHNYLSNAFVLTLARVRAVESNRYLLIAANGFPSVIISNTGEILGRRPNAELALVSATIPLINTQTPYSRLGDRVLFVPFLLVVVTFVYFRHQQKLRLFFRAS
jgi:apolipoprotein N-acyltransferase